MHRLLSVWGALLWLAFQASARTTADELADALMPLIEAHEGDVAVAVKDLATGESFEHQARKPMPTASLIKFPLMIAAYQALEDGQLDAEQTVTLQEEDKVPGSGILTSHFSAGTTMPLRDAIQLMIVYSDNTATNMVADAVGLDKTAKLMKRLGCPETKLHSKVYRRDTSIFPERSKKYGLGSATPADMVKLLELLHQRELVSPQASEKMLAHLYACEDKSKLSRFLPNVKIAHKTGAVNEVRTDAGLIKGPKGPIAVCVMTNGNKDQSWGSENAAEILCGRIAQIAYRHSSNDQEPAAEPNAGALRIGSAGPIVASLQRTLNARSEPSPELTPDGDFGPLTEDAVIDFQRAKNLQPTGIVGHETWQALGPLLEANSESPSPAIVNAEVLPKKPADSLDGPPFVSCKAWAIGDAETGEILWGFNENAPLDMASTTKIMTAYLAIKYAKEHPEILDEQITFSRRADDVIGSTADLRAGEVVAVRELLYGLMLPSGNDASVALGEFFGPRLSPDGNGPNAANHSPRKSYAQFIDAMNAAASELRMEQTHFDNTHGLTEKTHKASAQDLVTLACQAKKMPLFQQVTSTPQRGCTVVGPGGYRRNVVWKNTNQLLGIEGYDGVKTGTTSAAGACLVSSARRGDDALVVVVLGAASSDSRYVDTRNLYRWAWSQLEQNRSSAK